MFELGCELQSLGVGGEKSPGTFPLMAHLATTPAQLIFTEGGEDTAALLQPSEIHWG